MNSWVKLKRSKETDELLIYPQGFILYTQIALRARRTDLFNKYNLKPGEAIIGDFVNIGLTEQQYRTAKIKLQEWGLATFKSTPNGTIATITNSDIYDINIDEGNGQSNIQATNKQRASNRQVTTNKNNKKKKKENKFNINTKNQNYEKRFK